MMGFIKNDGIKSGEKGDVCFGIDGRENEGMIDNENMSLFCFEVGFLVEAVACEGAIFPLAGFAFAGNFFPEVGGNFTGVVFSGAVFGLSRPYFDGIDEVKIVLWVGVKKGGESVWVGNEVAKFVFAEVV